MRLRYTLLILTITLLQFSLQGQEKYYIQFTDKNNNPFSIAQPEEFLSPRAIERRLRQSIDIDVQDLPVNPHYVNPIKDLGVNVLYTLRWFNGAVVEVPSSIPASNWTIDSIAAMPFVESIDLVYWPPAKSVPMPDADIYSYIWARSTQDNYFDYGAGAEQIEMLNGHHLHNMGYRGQGITIALLDAGYLNTNTLSGFSHLFDEGRLKGTYDFVNPKSNIYREHGHGTVVLSAMATYLPGEMIGTAPDANYILIRTEDANTEQIIEEYNWAAGAELADSLGADIINSSLGYYLYDVPEQSHSYSDMDGATTPVTRAANHAERVGILVVTSAGNEGNKTWRHIISPGDAFHSLTVGAVDRDSTLVSFSSIGPTTDNRTKPEVVALGLSTAVQGTDGAIGSSSGTSLSAPIISGLAACLWQALPNLTAKELRNRIILSASRAANPDNSYGFGLPNFLKALDGESSVQTHIIRGLNLYPNPTSGHIRILIPSNYPNESFLYLYSMHGSLVHSEKVLSVNPIHTTLLPPSIPNGIYLITLQGEGLRVSGRLVKTASTQ